MTIKPCVLIGGPMDGWSGSFADKGQTVSLFGPPGEQDYPYRLDERATNDRAKTDKMVVWRFDQAGAQAIQIFKAQTGVNPLLDDAGAWGKTEGEDPEELETVRIRGEVRLNERTKEWELVFDGKVEAAAPQSTIGNAEEAMNWAAQVVGAEVRHGGQQ